MLSSLLALLLAAPQGEPALAALDVGASNGMFAAEVRKAAGQERVRDVLARWRLSVFELPRTSQAQPVWSCVFPHRAGERSYLLSDDGRSFAAVELEFSEGRALVRLWRDAQELAQLSSARLDVARPRSTADRPPPWLAVGATPLSSVWLDTPRGPTQFLELATSSGALRLVDLETGDVRGGREFVEPVVVAPAASRELLPGLRAASVRQLGAEPVAYWGEPFAVSVSGWFPTPNWCLMGFELRAGGADGHDLLLAALTAPPTANSVQLQVIENFNYVARITGLAPGSYRLRCENAGEGVRDGLTIEVRPARPFIELRRSGGFAGMDQSVRVYAKGVAVEHWSRPVREPAVRFTVLRIAARGRIAELARLALDQPLARSGTAVVDALDVRLTIFDGERAHESSFLDVGADGARRQLVEALVRLFD